MGVVCVFLGGLSSNLSNPSNEERMLRRLQVTPLLQLSTKCWAATLPDHGSHSCANQFAASPVKPRQTQLSAAPLGHHLGPSPSCGIRSQPVNSQTNQYPPSLILAGAPGVPCVPTAPGGLQQHKGSFGKWLKSGRHL